MSMSWNRRIAVGVLSATIVAVTAAWPVGAGAQPQQPLAAQSSSERGVTVKVVPRSLGPAAPWEFVVTLDTHSADLDDDLMNSAVLVVDGAELRPTSWTGPGPGGHHREGVLKFAAPAQAPQAVELRIRRSGESEARVFRWSGEALR